MSISMSKSRQSWLKELFERLLKIFADKYYGSRAEFNREDLTYLLRDKTFQEDIRNIRKELKIPKLKPEQDLRFVPVDFGNENKDIEQSDWIHALSEQNFNAFDSKVKWLLSKYKLPLNFYDALEGYLLYRKKPKTPVYNLGLVSQILLDPNELKRIPLTTSEKHLIKLYLLDEYGEKIMKDKKLRLAYQNLVQDLAVSKNKRRKLSNFKSALKALHKPQRHEKYYDDVEGQEIEPKFTFKDLAVKEYVKVNTESEATRKAALLRKQKQRLKDRYSYSKS